MNFTQQNDSVAVLCDWRGQVKSLSCRSSQTLVGTVLSDVVAQRYREQFINAFSSVNALHSRTELFVVNENERSYKVWMWPLGTPDAAVSAIFEPIPSEVHELSKREIEYVQVVAGGATPKQIAEELDVSLNTVHVQLRTIREKLDLDTNNRLLCFAARYF